MTQPTIAIDGATCRLTFRAYDIDAYHTFLKAKALPEKAVEYDFETDTYTLTTHARFAARLGATDAPAYSTLPLPPSDYLFDYQKFLVERMIEAQRFACFADCVAGDTIIQGPDGCASIEDLAERGKPIRVWALTRDGRQVAARATCPFRKGYAPLYRFTLEDGRSIEVTARHRFLTSRGWQFAENVTSGDWLAVSELGPHPTIEEHDRATSLPDAPYSMQRHEGSMDHYWNGSRQYDPQPQSVEDNGQEPSPSQADAHAPCLLYPHEDDRGHRSLHIHRHQNNGHLSRLDLLSRGNCVSDGAEYHASPSHPKHTVSSSRASLQSDQSSALLPSIGGFSRYEDQGWICAQSSFPYFYVEHSGEYHADALPAAQARLNIPTAHLSVSSSIPAPSIHGFEAETDQCGTYAGGSSCLSFRRVVCINYTRKAPYFDLHVPGYQNYLANGIWNHNTGLGKSAMELEVARQVLHLLPGKFLILTFLPIIPQMMEMARQWYPDMPLRHLTSREDLIAWLTSDAEGVAISNYEKFIPGIIPEMRHLSGVAFDESSFAKTSGGVIKWNVIKSVKGLPYKFCFSATPAPNDIMEYASQASLLEKIQGFWDFFVKRGNGKGDWELKPHAERAFYTFMGSWSCYMRNPARFGFADNLSSIPAPVFIDVPIPATEEQHSYALSVFAKAGSGLFGDRALGVTWRTKLSQAAKGFLYDKCAPNGSVKIESEKPAEVAEIAARCVVEEGRQVLIWTVFDEESVLIEEALSRIGGIPYAALHGKHKEEARLSTLEAFRKGEIRALVSKAGLLGFGMNFQFCSAMIFSGVSDSYEQFYQAVRRAYRYGQTEAVQIYLPVVTELEKPIMENLDRKRVNFEADAQAHEDSFVEVFRQQH